ncbi:lipase (class 2) domain-containing protein [Ditylenchus destructor]|nr:lipase (class 2) domain-containing protein [Ditylenchus destructor]
MVPIPEVDRGRAEFPNVKGIVMEVTAEGMHKIGTEHGVLNNLYAANCITPCREAFLTLENVPENSKEGVGVSHARIRALLEISLGLESRSSVRPGNRKNPIFGETGTNRLVSPRGSDWCITRPDPSAYWKVSLGPDPGLPEAVTPGRIDLCRGDRYQSSCLTERKRLVYHTPGSERLLKSWYIAGHGKTPINLEGPDWITDVSLNMGYNNTYQSNLKTVILLRYSGKAFATFAPINHYPVIFIHGNSDGALSANYDAQPNLSDEGWSASIAEFLQNGYTSSELYAVTYGDRELENAVHRTMDCKTVIRLRRFVEAVLTYTNSSYVDIISHSMGVSLARRLIKGGHLSELSNTVAHKVNSIGVEGDDFNECHIGESIHRKIHTFIGIAGANYGMCFCSGEETEKTMAAYLDDTVKPR